MPGTGQCDCSRMMLFTSYIMNMATWTHTHEHLRNDRSICFVGSRAHLDASGDDGEARKGPQIGTNPSSSPNGGSTHSSHNHMRGNVRVCVCVSLIKTSPENKSYQLECSLSTGKMAPLRTGLCGRFRRDDGLTVTEGLRG